MCNDNVVNCVQSVVNGCQPTVDSQVSQGLKDGNAQTQTLVQPTRQLQFIAIKSWRDREGTNGGRRKEEMGEGVSE